MLGGLRRTAGRSGLSLGPPHKLATSLTQLQRNAHLSSVLSSSSAPPAAAGRGRAERDPRSVVTQHSCGRQRHTKLFYHLRAKESSGVVVVPCSSPLLGPSPMSPARPCSCPTINKSFAHLWLHKKRKTSPGKEVSHTCSLSLNANCSNRTEARCLVSHHWKTILSVFSSVACVFRAVTA